MGCTESKQAVGGGKKRKDEWTSLHDASSGVGRGRGERGRKTSRKGGSGSKASSGRAMDTAVDTLSQDCSPTAQKKQQQQQKKKKMKLHSGSESLKKKGLYKTPSHSSSSGGIPISPTLLPTTTSTQEEEEEEDTALGGTVTTMVGGGSSMCGGCAKQQPQLPRVTHDQAQDQAQDDDDDDSDASPKPDDGGRRCLNPLGAQEGPEEEELLRGESPVENTPVVNVEGEKEVRITSPPSLPSSHSLPQDPLPPAQSGDCPNPPPSATTHPVESQPQPQSQPQKQFADLFNSQEGGGGGGGAPLSDSWVDSCFTSSNSIVAAAIASSHSSRASTTLHADAATVNCPAIATLIETATPEQRVKWMQDPSNKMTGISSDLSEKNRLHITGWVSALGRGGSHSSSLEREIGARQRGGGQVVPDKLTLVNLGQNDKLLRHSAKKHSQH